MPLQGLHRLVYTQVCESFREKRIAQITYRAVLITRRHDRLFGTFVIEPLKPPGGVRRGVGAPPRVAGGVRGGRSPPHGSKIY